MKRSNRKVRHSLRNSHKGNFYQATFDLKYMKLPRPKGEKIHPYPNRSGDVFPAFKEKQDEKKAKED